jgi:glycosyltransferase involved in cell wall biosynthesis/peptidoglycan/xylan/chitin deacetylase (PgdA/CDA1 family)
MLLLKTYYLLKPFIPLQLRVAMRQMRAGFKRRALQDWPINHTAGDVPPNWPGWPGNKKFALVLTHDVEAKKGYGRVEQLLNFEIQNGFRSAFNFVPERDYVVTEDMRSKLKKNGFEVGVHGLHHDGKLYSSKAEFARRALRIKKYLNDWGAKGFRSPLMHHELSWIHQLGAEYDCSTFDTDPFEPQPDGYQTIFPFWVPNPNGRGYIELPYTLVQDFTLFKILDEKTIDVWKQKLDWIAEKGGMALLNTHPDYMSFEGKQDKDEYPVALYQEFLDYVRSKYPDQYWSATPGEVSQYVQKEVPMEKRNTRKRICMVAYTNYECDNRVRRYAEALARRGDLVDVIALSSGEDNAKEEKLEGVNVFRVQTRNRNEKGKWTYALRLIRFLFKSGFVLASRHRKIRYDLVHVHNVPDFLSFAALAPKFSGAKVILDIHDIVPELFGSKFGATEQSFYYSLLKRVEKASMSFADHVIISNHLWKDTITRRSVPEEKCSVFINHVDPAVFYPHQRTRNDGKFVVIFPGSFQWHQGLDLAINAFVKVRENVPNAEFHIYGGGAQEDELKKLTNDLNLNAVVKFCGSLPLEKMAEVIANADLGVVPKRANSFGNEAYSTKIMEFMSQGIPVVVSSTKIDRYYFDDRVVRFFPSGDVDALADAMIEVIQSESLQKSLIERGREYVSRNNWNIKKQEYLDLVDSLNVERFGEAEKVRAIAAEQAK